MSRKLYGCVAALAAVTGALVVAGESRAEQGAPAGERELLEAIDFMRQERCDKAIPLLKRSYDVGKLRNALWNLAECYARVERSGFAIEAYRRYLEEPETRQSPTDREAARQAIARLSPRVAKLTVSCPVKGARVHIGGYDLGQTPLTTSIEAGLHVVEVSALGFATARREIQLDAGDEEELEIPLELEPGRLTVTSEPTGAEVRLDGEPLGQTNMSEQEVPSGGHVVTLSLEGYRSVDRFITLQPDQVVPLAITLEPVSGRLDVTTGVEGARLLVDGDERGSGAFSSLSLSPGRHELQVEAPDHASWTGPVEIIDRRITAVELDLARNDRLHQAWFWATAAIAAGSIAASVVLFVDGRSAMNDVNNTAISIDTGGDEILHLRETQEDKEDYLDWARDMYIRGIVLAVVGGLATVAAALLAWRTQFRRARSEAEISTSAETEVEGERSPAVEGDAP